MLSRSLAKGLLELTPGLCIGLRRIGPRGQNRGALKIMTSALTLVNSVMVTAVVQQNVPVISIYWFIHMSNKQWRAISLNYLVMESSERLYCPHHDLDSESFRCLDIPHPIDHGLQSPGLSWIAPYWGMAHTAMSTCSYCALCVVQFSVSEQDGWAAQYSNHGRRGQALRSTDQVYKLKDGAHCTVSALVQNIPVFLSNIVPI